MINGFPKYSYFLFLVLCLCSIDSAAQTPSKNVNNTFSLKVTGSKAEGWNYQIYRGEKMVIKQTIIPAIGGNRKFRTEEDAKKVGELVLKKLTINKSDFPSVEIFELDSLKIKY